MALKATVYKADLQISDMDKQYYQNHALTVAQHPSETLERMMIRLMVFALHAHEDLAQLVQRKMTLQCSIQDNEAWFGDEKNSVHIVPAVMK